MTSKFINYCFNYLEQPKKYILLTFEDDIDAELAIDNMNNAELFGKYIRVKY